MSARLDNVLDLVQKARYHSKNNKYLDLLDQAHKLLIEAKECATSDSKSKLDEWFDKVLEENNTHPDFITYRMRPSFTEEYDVEPLFNKAGYEQVVVKNVRCETNGLIEEDNFHAKYIPIEPYMDIPEQYEGVYGYLYKHCEFLDLNDLDDLEETPYIEHSCEYDEDAEPVWAGLINVYLYVKKDSDTWTKLVTRKNEQSSYTIDLKF